MEAIVWLSAYLVITAAAIGGIVYLQLTSRAGKYAWQQKGICSSIGCLASVLHSTTVMAK